MGGGSLDFAAALSSLGKTGKMKAVAADAARRGGWRTQREERNKK